MTNDNMNKPVKTIASSKVMPMGIVIVVAFSLLFAVSTTNELRERVLRTAIVKDVATSGHVVSYDLAYHQSYGFFDNIEESDWKRIQQRVKERVSYINPGNKLGRYGARRRQVAVWYQNNLEPDFSCLHERRIGGLGDGPKWVCDPHRIPKIARDRQGKGGPPCLVYSIGSAGNFVYEDALQDFFGEGVCEIHVFDFGNFSRPGDEARGIFYHAWGIEGSVNATKEEVKRIAPNLKTIHETVEELGHQNRIIDLFKIDCEGCEWHSFEDWLQYDIRQIQVETHLVPPYATEFFESIQNAGYLMYHKEHNVIDNGDCAEFGYIKVRPEFFEENSYLDEE